MLRKLFRALFVRADKTYPKRPWCPSCKEPHFSYLNKQNWKLP